MVTIDDIRRIAVTFPEVEESTHFRFRQPIFSVRGKPFAGGGGGKGELAAVFSISPEEASAAVAHDPAIYEEIWRPGAHRSFVGVRVDLAKVSKKRVQDLVEHAWRHKAPKNVVSAYEETMRATKTTGP